MKWAALMLILLAPPAAAQSSMGAPGGYGSRQQQLHPTLDAEAAFFANDRERMPTPECGPRPTERCRKMIKYSVEYNRTLEALARKYPK